MLIQDQYQKLRAAGNQRDKSLYHMAIGSQGKGKTNKHMGWSSPLNQGRVISCAENIWVQGPQV